MIPYDISIRYMIVGYSLIFFVLAVYLTSLVIRWKNLKRDIQLIEELKQKP